MTETTRTSPDTREVPLPVGGEVDIFLTANDIHLRGIDRDVVTVRTRGGEDLDGEIRLEADRGRVILRDNDSMLRLGPVRVRGHRAAALDIELPKGARLSVRTLSGDVEADGIGGESRWSTASGDVHISADGGSLTADTMSGDLVVEASAAIGVRARSVSGDLRVRAPRVDALEVSTTSGDVRIDAALGATFEHRATSVSGDILFETTSPVRLETQTIAGDVRATGMHRTEGGRGRRTIVTGDGSVRVSARTTSGDIRLRNDGAADAAVAGAPAAPAPATPPTGADVPAAPVAPIPPVPPAAPVPPEVADATWVVAEAEAAPNLVRPVAPDATSSAVADTAATTGAESPLDRREAARLDILRALERGELDIEAASHRLEQLEEAGPRFFRGFC